MADRALRVKADPVSTWAQWKIRESVDMEADTVLVSAVWADGDKRQVQVHLIGDANDLLFCVSSAVLGLNRHQKWALLKMLLNRGRRAMIRKEVQ
ncbi:MAG: hypothetical protein IJ438_01005 [Clostridia bacterium]|nr:hypothetical protein [Clostridia bacterium]MBQ8554426.1 hypothetical protein [Clostridia bacterium]